MIPPALLVGYPEAAYPEAAYLPVHRLEAAFAYHCYQPQIEAAYPPACQARAAVALLAAAAAAAAAAARLRLEAYLCVPKITKA